MLLQAGSPEFLSYPAVVSLKPLWEEPSFPLPDVGSHQGCLCPTAGPQSVPLFSVVMLPVSSVSTLSSSEAYLVESYPTSVQPRLSISDHACDGPILN